MLDSDGTPLAGVTVDVSGFLRSPGDQATDLLFHWDNTLATISRPAVTDAHGEFATAPLPPGFYRVLPVEQNHHPSKGETFHQLPAPFTPRKVTLKEGEAPPPIELRALPHVVVEARLLDRRGKPRSGPSFLLGGRIGDGKDKGKPQDGLFPPTPPSSRTTIPTGRAGAGPTRTARSYSTPRAVWRALPPPDGILHRREPRHAAPDRERRQPALRRGHQARAARPRRQGYRGHPLRVADRRREGRHQGRLEAQGGRRDGRLSRRQGLGRGQGDSATSPAARAPTSSSGSSGTAGSAPGSSSRTRRRPSPPRPTDTGRDPRR